ncbi:MAG: ATPase AAA [Methyloligella sp.]|nr:MAG: ATPase AAA [Methyloligella sp.]
MTNISQTGDKIIEEVEAASAKINKIKAAASSKIYGQDDVIDLGLITILSGGHALLIGVPGLAKTLLVETLGTVLGLTNKRVQFTPDLMPSDIVGAEVLEQSSTGERSFRFIKGPIFTQLLMADEINRASPRTQSALLQAMQEKHVTVAGSGYELPAPFHVLATQNPLEQEGTYPLPEAQLDRFLTQINVNYPDKEAERKVLYQTTGTETQDLQSIVDGEQLLSMQHLVRQLPIGETIVEAILDLVRSARPNEADALPIVNEMIAWGPGPRAAQALSLGVRARALIDGRLAPSLDDVVALAEPVLKHRMALTFDARTRGVTLQDIIATLTSGVLKD